MAILGDTEFWDAFSVTMALTLIESDRPSAHLRIREGDPACTTLQCFVFECGSDTITCNSTFDNLVKQAIKDIVGDGGDWKVRAAAFRDELMSCATMVDKAMEAA
jgi:hypothetical protein